MKCRSHMTWPVACRAGGVLNTHPTKGTDSASGLKKRPDEETLGTTSSVGGVEEGFKLVFG